MFQDFLQVPRGRGWEMSLPGWLSKLECLGATDFVYPSFCPVLWEPLLWSHEQFIWNLLKHACWVSTYVVNMTKAIAFKRGGTSVQMISLQDGYLLTIDEATAVSVVMYKVIAALIMSESRFLLTDPLNSVHSNLYNCIFSCSCFANNVRLIF